MNYTVELRTRTAAHVRIYYEKTQDAEIRKMLPQKAQTVEEALAAFENTLKPDSTSYGRTIYADGDYVGDIWCYCIGEEPEPDAMVSYCIFDKSRWNKGVATKALALFLAEIVDKFGLKHVGAFTFAENIPSLCVLQRNGFNVVESFDEDGVQSLYLQCDV